MGGESGNGQRYALTFLSIKFAQQTLLLVLATRSFAFLCIAKHVTVEVLNSYNIFVKRLSFAHKVKLSLCIAILYTNFPNVLNNNSYFTARSLTAIYSLPGSCTRNLPLWVPPSVMVISQVSMISTWYSVVSSK